MLNYDDKKNILYAYQNELARPSLRVDNTNNVVYQSFREYLEQQVKDDVMNVLMPALQNAIKVAPELFNTSESRIVVKQVDPGVFNDRTHHVTVRFELNGFDNSRAQDVTVMELPHVEENGIIEFDSKQYSFIHMLEQEPTVSYESNESTRKPPSLKVKNGQRTIWIDDDSKKLRIRFSDRSGKSSKTKYTLITLIAAMADNEGYNVDDIWNEFANFSTINMFKNEWDRQLHMYWYGGNNGSINASDYKDELVTRLTMTRLKYNGEGDTAYDNNSVREELNSLLSLDRAVGEILAKDVESTINPGRILAKAGTTIDRNMISVFNAEGVYKLYVKYIPNVEGYFLTETIIINKAPRGLKITDSLRQHFPDEKGMYLSHDYERIPNAIIYEMGSPITADMINVIASFGRDTIKISDKPSGGKEYVLNFFEEILSNRQFLGKYIGRNADMWYYLNKDGNFVFNDGTYTTYDLVALQSFCTKLFEGKWIDKVVNADSGFRKMLVPLAEQYHRAFCYAVREGMRQMNRKFKTIYNNNKEFFLERDRIDNEFYPLNKNFWKYLRDEAKCLIALRSDNLHNPVAYQSACTKINVFTRSKHSISDTQREIAIGSFGKIDPFEIPQSAKMGVVQNSTCGAVIDKDGKIKTPYYELMHNGTQSKILTNKVHELSSMEEEPYVIADLCSLEFDENGIIHDNTKNVLCRVPSIDSVEKQTFAFRPISQIRYVNVSATQSLSWASSTIPFMSSNDAARAIFAVAQEKQAKGLVNPEEPDCMTSAWEQFVWLNDKFGIIAKEDGEIVLCDYNYRTEEYMLHIKYDSQDGVDNGTIHKFKEYFDSGYSVTKMKVLVKTGDRIKAGQMLVSSNFISENGIMTLGCNALTAYICDGYNYEDGSHISTSMLERLQSYRVNKEEFSGNPRTIRRYSIDKKPVGRWVTTSESPNIEVSWSDKNFNGKTKSLQKLEKAYGFIESTEPLKAEHTRGNYGVELHTISVDSFSRGDKASNRHGNKGVLSKQEPTQNMPRLKNGMPIDVCLNPLGVGSRMNIGQIKEIHCGLIAHVLNIKISADAYNSISDNEISMLMELTYELANSTGDAWTVLSKYSQLLSNSFLQHCADVINDIRIYRDCFDKNGTTRLILPTNDGRFTETKCLIGYMYVFKLIQESHKKIHARGGETIGEPYGEMTDAPTHGSSKGGGQRFGTMEMDALCAYGVSGYLEELTNERCDNAIRRNNMYVDTYLPPKLRDQYRIDGYGQRRSVTQFLYSMLALGIMCEPNHGEFLPLSKDNGTELAHWKPSVLQRANSNYFKNLSKASDISSSSENEIDEQQQEYQNAKQMILGSFD